MTTAVDTPPVELYIPPDLTTRRTLGPFNGPWTTPDRILEATWLATVRAHRDAPSFNRWVGYYLSMIHRAEALDIPVGVGIDHIYLNDEGRAGLTAFLMGGLLLRAGIIWKPVVRSETHVKLRFLRRGGRKTIATAEWDIAKAARAKLTHRWAWRQYPMECLEARTISLAVRQNFSGIVTCGYTWDEVRHNEVDADHDATADLPPRVVELLDQANAADASSEHIRRTLIAAVKKEKLGVTAVGDGRDLDQAMHEAWLAAANRESLPVIDAALATVGPDQPLPDAPTIPQPDDVEHAAAGELHCGCDAAVHARTGAHTREGCTDEVTT